MADKMGYGSDLPVGGKGGPYSPNYGQYAKQRQERIDARIDEAFPPSGTIQPAHEGSQSQAPNKENP